MLCHRSFIEKFWYIFELRRSYYLCRLPPNRYHLPNPTPWAAAVPNQNNPPPLQVKATVSVPPPTTRPLAPHVLQQQPKGAANPNTNPTQTSNWRTKSVPRYAKREQLRLRRGWLRRKREIWSKRRGIRVMSRWGGQIRRMQWDGLLDEWLSGNLAMLLMEDFFFFGRKINSQVD